MTTQPSPQQLYRKAMRREVYLPLALALALIVAGAAVMLLLPTRAQVSLMTDWLWSMLVLLPLVVCMVPLAIGAVLLVVAAGRLPGMARKPLQRGQSAVQGIQERVTTILEQIHHVLIDFSSRLAAVERVNPLEEPPPPEHGAKSDEHPDSP